MNEFKYALRRFYRGGSLNNIKVISLGLGFAISFLLLSKVAYELSFDSYLKDYDRIYLIKATYNGIGRDEMVADLVQGPVAHGMKEEIPEVEASTRWTTLSEDSKIYLADKKAIHYTSAVIADAHFFDIISTRVISGDPTKILSQRMYCMISDVMADKIGGDAVGQTIEFMEYPGIKFVIGGIYKALPDNSTYKMDVLISMPSIGQFMNDYSEDWLGNDRYVSYVKLAKGTHPESLKESIHAMQEKYQDLENLKKVRGVSFYYHLSPIKSLHLEDRNISTSLFLVSIIGLVVLLISLFNYVLLRITTIMNGAKNNGIRKCLGAGNREIMKGIWADTAIHIVLATVVGMIFILILRSSLGNIIDLPLNQTLTLTSILIGIGLILVSALLISTTLAKLSTKYALITAIQEHDARNRKWKIALLFIEGLGVTFLLCTVYFVRKQYDYSINIDKGFSTDNVFFTPTSAIDSMGIRGVEERLRSMPMVESVSLAYVTPFDKEQSGNTIKDPVTNKLGRSIADFYYADKFYLDLLKIPIIEGEEMNETNVNGNNAWINRTLAKQLAKDYGWTDGVIGKELHLSARNAPQTITGVFDDIRINRFDKTFIKDEGIILNGGASYKYCHVLLIRLKDNVPSTTRQVEEAINEYSIYGDVELKSADSAVRELYKGMQNLGHYTVFGSVIAVIIALIGIIGYTEEEVVRRRKEIAIRKVNGATYIDIVRLFLTNYLKVGIPSVFIGLILAFIAMRHWVQTLADQISMSLFPFAVIGALVLLVTCLIMTIYCYFTANNNPTKYLSEE